MPKPVRVPVLRLPHGEGVTLPTYQTPQSAGLDLQAAVDETTPVTIAPAGRALIPTGLVIALPKGTEAQVRPRSGLALKHGVTLLNTPGTIDADYRGEVMVLLINLGTEPFVVRRGERIAQMVIAEVRQAKLVAATRLNETKRGAGGFGSTGVTTAKKAAKPRSTAARSTGSAAPKKSISPSTKKSKLLPKVNKTNKGSARKSGSTRASASRKHR